MAWGRSWRRRGWYCFWCGVGGWKEDKCLSWQSGSIELSVVSTLHSICIHLLSVPIFAHIWYFTSTLSSELYNWLGPQRVHFPMMKTKAPMETMEMDLLQPSKIPCLVYVVIYYYFTGRGVCAKKVLPVDLPGREQRTLQKMATQI